MLQMVKKLFIIIASVAMCNCDRADFKGLIMPPSDGVDKRFEQSMAMNEGLKADVIGAQEDYTFYVAADPHINDTYRNLGIFNDIFRNDSGALFGVILGDCVDLKDNFWRYLQAISYDAEKHACNHTIFNVLGNHDVYFNGWADFKECIGTSVYWFEVLFEKGKDLFITLDTATGTLGRRQTEWFKAFLAEKREEFRHCVIFTHTNIFYTDNSQTGSGNMPFEESLSLIEFLGEQKVSVVLQGHDHYKEDLSYDNVRYAVLGTIRDEAKAPEYLKVKVDKDGLCLDWQLII